MTLPLIITLWLSPSLLFIARGFYLQHLDAAFDRGYKAGYDDCAEDVEKDAIDQLHRDIERFVRENA